MQQQTVAAIVRLQPPGTGVNRPVTSISERWSLCSLVPLLSHRVVAPTSRGSELNSNSSSVLQRNRQCYPSPLPFHSASLYMETSNDRAVKAGSAASKSGVRAKDVVKAVNGNPCLAYDNLMAIIGAMGRPVQMEFRRLGADGGDGGGGGGGGGGQGCGVPSRFSSRVWIIDSRRRNSVVSYA